MHINKHIGTCTHVLRDKDKALEERRGPRRACAHLGQGPLTHGDRPWPPGRTSENRTRHSAQRRFQVGGRAWRPRQDGNPLLLPRPGLDPAPPSRLPRRARPGSAPCPPPWLRPTPPRDPIGCGHNNLVLSPAPSPPINQFGGDGLLLPGGAGGRPPGGGDEREMDGKPSQ